MKNTIFYLTCFIAATSFSQTSFSEKKLDEKLNALLKESHAPSFSIAIVKDNKVIYSKGFGWSNVEKDQKADQNTLYAIGSTSKAFTTALLGIMEAENGLKFDDNPRKYLPKLEFFNDELNTKLTIKDLVSHRSGLPRHDSSWYLFPTEDKDSLLARIKYHEPFAALRNQWYYNNFGYLIQGMITEKLTGKSWEQNIRDRFFMPMGMERSNLSIAELQQKSNIAKGYEWKNFETTEPTDYFNIAAISPAGSINSSASEMSVWLQVWLNKGKYNGKQILPESYVQKAINPLMLVGEGIGDPQFADQHLKSYGYAWFVSSYKGHYRLEHGGNIDGFTANVALFPSDNLGIVVLCNQDGSMLPSLARNIVSDYVLNLKNTDWINYFKEKVTKAKLQVIAVKKEQVDNSIKGTKPSHISQEFVGDYSHPGYGKFRLTVEKDSLFAQFPEKKFYLKHQHYDIFMPIAVEKGIVKKDSELGISFNFKTSDMGEINSVSIKLEPTLDPIEFKRTPIITEVNTDKLKTYIGTYELAGTQLKISANDKGNLLLDVPGQPQYNLLSISETEFAIKGLSDYKAKFLNDSDGKPELQLIQPNGTFTAKKK